MRNAIVALQFVRVLPIALGMALLAAGCASSRGASRAQPAGDASEIRAIQPPRGASTVVLYKKNAFKSMFGPIRMQSNVFVDQVPSGDMADYQYAVIHLPPGRHSLRTFAAIQGTNFSATKIVNTQPDQVLFVELQTSQGWNNATVTLEPKEEGHDALYEEVATCKLAFEADLTTSRLQ